MLTSCRNLEVEFTFYSPINKTNFLLSLQPSAPKEPQEPQAITENFFRTPGGPNTEPSLPASSDGTQKTSQGTLYIPQRKLEVSED